MKVRVFYSHCIQVLCLLVCYPLISVAQVEKPVTEVLLYVSNDKIADKKALLAELKPLIIRSNSLLNGVLFVIAKDKIPTNLFLTEKHNDLLWEDNVIYHVQKNSKFYKPFTPSISNLNQVSILNDPLFPKQWSLLNDGTNAPQQPEKPQPGSGVAGVDLNMIKAWSFSQGSKKIKVAVIDTGIDYNHVDLKKNMWINDIEYSGKLGVDDDGNGYVDDIHGYDFASNRPDPMDKLGHGTHCAGIVGAVHNNNVGIAGIMADVTLVPLKIFDDEGNATAEYAILAIDYATKMGVNIISASWGGRKFSQNLKDAIQRAAYKGILFVAAAGNDSRDNDTEPLYPASYDVPNIISVAAYTHKNDLAWFSNFGQKSVHVSAPGLYILSTVPGDQYAVYSGTSMATPHVSGVLGLLLAKEGGEGQLSIAEIKNRLIETSIPKFDWRKKMISRGRVDAYTLLINQTFDRRDPLESEWKVHSLDQPFETLHPLGSEMNMTRTFTVPKARFIRLIIKKYDLYKSSATLSVVNPRDRTEPEVITGAGGNYKTDFLQGNSIGIRLSASSPNSWGVVIDSVEYVE